MKDLRTRTKLFDCDFFIQRENPRQLMIRVKNTTMREVENTFRNPTEISELTFRGRPYNGFEKCLIIRNEGAQIFLILEGE